MGAAGFPQEPWLFSSKSFADAHAPGPTIPALGEVSAKIDVIFLTQLISRPSTHIGQEVVILEQHLTRSGDDSAKTSECSQTKPLWQCQAILYLCRRHVPVEVLAGCVSSQFVLCPINAISIEGWLAAGAAGKQIICKDLILTQAFVFVEGKSVSLEGVFATQRLHEKIAGEFELFSCRRIELIGPCVADHPQAQRPQDRMESHVRRDRRNFTIFWSQRNKRAPRPKSRANEDFPPRPAQKFCAENLAGLNQRQLQSIENSAAVQVVVHIASDRKSTRLNS